MTFLKVNILDRGFSNAIYGSRTLHHTKRPVNGNFLFALRLTRKKRKCHSITLLRRIRVHNLHQWKSNDIYVYIYFIRFYINLLYIHHHHHHHHVVSLARISLTLSRHFSLSFIASGRSSGLHPVSSHSCWMYVRAGRPAFAWPYVGVHRSTSLMSSSLLLQQYTACLVRLTWIVFVMGDRWPYSWCIVGCCRQDLFNIARSILL